MTPDLITQANQLKNLSDEALGREAQQPSGIVPPFLVLSELGRRQKMRQTYQTAVQRRAPRTTVAQDLTSPATGGLDALPGVPGVVGAPDMTGGVPMPPAPGMADGGLVQAGYADGGIVDMLTNSLGGIMGPDEMRRMAIINMGLGIAGGNSPYPLQNIATGAASGLQTYAQQRQDAQRQRLETLLGISNVEHSQRSDDLANMELMLRERQFNAEQDPNSPQNTPASVREWQYEQSLPPDQQGLFQNFAHPSFMSMQNRDDTNIQRAYNTTFNQIYARLSKDPANLGVPDDQLRAMARQQTNSQFAANYPGWVQRLSELQAAGALADPLDGGATTSGVSQTDPLGLGL